MFIRPFDRLDTGQIVHLFRETVRSINRRDYTENQVTAWAPDVIDHEAWLDRLIANQTVVAVDGDVVIGFAELEAAGRIHTLYVHKAHQRRGVASALLQELESRAKYRNLDHLHTEASITARSFFQCRGYAVVRQQTVQLRGQSFINYWMEKRLATGPKST